jgi:hypothetical protein
MSEDDDDILEHPEPTRKEISLEPIGTLAIGEQGAQGPNSDGASVGEADTDRFDIVEGRRGDLAIASKAPKQLILNLRAIRSLNAKCFFCKELECDQVFVAKSASPGKTRAYAVHSTCVFDHAQLQDLPSESL